MGKLKTKYWFAAMCGDETPLEKSLFSSWLYQDYLELAESRFKTTYGGASKNIIEDIMHDAGCYLIEQVVNIAVLKLSKGNFDEKAMLIHNTKLTLEPELVF